MQNPESPKRSNSVNSNGWLPASRNLTAALSAAEVQHRIEEALRQSRDFDGGGISVSVANGTVTMAGQVNSRIEREEALNLGWCAPGVVKVLDRISIKKR